MHADGGDMAVSFLGLLIVAGMAGVMFLAVLGLMTLLTNPKTRDMAKILLGGPGSFDSACLSCWSCCWPASPEYRGTAPWRIKRQCTGRSLPNVCAALGEEFKNDHRGTPDTIELVAEVEAVDSTKEAFRRRGCGHPRGT